MKLYFRNRGEIMGRKIFISYKYKDYDVKELSIDTRPTWPCDYVNYIIPYMNQEYSLNNLAPFL